MRFTVAFFAAVVASSLSGSVAVLAEPEPRNETAAVAPSAPKEIAPQQRPWGKSRRRHILEKELALEESLLARAREDMELHEKNVAALKRELAGRRR